MFSLIGIKPDAFLPDAKREAGSELKKPLPNDSETFINRLREAITENALRIVEEKRYVVPREIADEHYAEHRGVFDANYAQNKHEFLVGYLSSSPSHWFIVEGEDAIAKGRKIIVDVREEYLVDRKKARYNMTHASDSPESVRSEIALHFPNFTF